MLITDPNTGEILALVSIRDGQTAALSAINTPYEPGSTLKPFTVAGLLERDLVSLYDTVDGENGAWRVNGRTLHDVHGSGRMTIADALRTSSNVGIAKAAQSMSPGDQYENLRDFGLGTLTGIEIPGEVSGTLRRPDSWSSQSAVSLAIGYEVNVTPLQMAMAYGALANGGRIMQPHLVKEIRDGTGALIEAFQPRVVREVVSADVARRVGRVLEDVVEDGTGKSARLATFRVAGKSGTTRLYSPAGGYEQGAYWSSFVGFFPADAPQLVVFVKLERPKGIYYGGAVAGPVTHRRRCWPCRHGSRPGRAIDSARPRCASSFRQPTCAPRWPRDRTIRLAHDRSAFAPSRCHELVHRIRLRGGGWLRRDCPTPRRRRLAVADRGPQAPRPRTAGVARRIR